MKKQPYITHNKPYLTPQDTRAVIRALGTGWLAEGSQARILEKKAASILKQRYAKVTSSGTSALHLALLALGVEKGDEVILSTYVCTALLNAIHYVGAKPKLVDIEETTLGPSPQAIKANLTKKTRAVLVNHAFGIPASIQKIQSFGIPIIEDCAQGLGSRFGNKPLGSFGDMTILSFYATKLMTAGYGGMVLSSHKKYANTIWDLTHFDQRKDYKVRYNYSLSDLNAALGLSQLSQFPKMLQRRRKIASQYQMALSQSSFYYWADPLEGGESNFYRFVMGTIHPAEKWIRYFKKQRIQVIQPIEPYQLLHRYLKLPASRFPVAESLAKHLISIPIYPALKDNEIKRIVSILRRLP